MSRWFTAAHRTTTQAATPDGVDGFVALDWEDGRIIGIEILDASSRLSQDILDEAEHTSSRLIRQARTTPACCSRPPPNLGARSRGQGWRSPPPGYGLDPGEDDDTIPRREQPA